MKPFAPPENLTIEVITEDQGWENALGGAEAFARRVLEATGAAEAARGEVIVLFCNDATMRDLNFAHRNKNAPTNVLSFPGSPAMRGFIGDIALGYETIAREAQEQGKTLPAHAAHMLTHGFLHLLGYDHDTEGGAERMEAKERDILATLGWSDPYASEHMSDNG